MSAEGVDKVLGVNLVDGSVYCYPFDNRRIPDCTRRARVVLAFIKDGFFEWMPDAVEMIQYIRELFANGETVDRRSNLTGM